MDAIRPRRTRRRNSPPLAAPQIITGAKRLIPTYDLASEDRLDLIEARSDQLLKEIGVRFVDDPEALRLFHDAGADVQGERVRFEPGHLRQILRASALPSFTQHARNPARSIQIGGDNVVFGPGYGMPFVRDLDNGRRYGTIRDFENLIKLTYMSPWLHHSSGTICEPTDLPVNKRHLDMVYAHLTCSDKPFMGSVTAPERARDSIAMARIAFGASFVDKNCVIMANINMNSPLVFDHAMSSAIRIYAEANQCPVIVPFVLGGATAPVSMAAAVTQAYSEVLVGSALGQLARPGSPVIFGNFVTTVDLKSGSPTFGTPEAALGSYVAGQLGRRIGLPLRCSGAFSASKLPDAQSMMESVTALQAAVMSGANFVLQSAGWLEGALTMSYEKLVMDADYLGSLHIFLKGLPFDDEAFAMDAFGEVGPGGHFFGCGHTMRHYQDAFYDAVLSDKQNFETWSDRGSQDMVQRANQKWKRDLEQYEAPILDPAVNDELLSFMAKRKEDLPDTWH